MCQGRAEQGILWGISAPNFRDSHKEIGIQEGIHRALMSISLQNTPDRVVRDVEQLINQRFLRISAEAAGSGRRKTGGGRLPALEVCPRLLSE